MSLEGTESPGMFELMTWATVHKQGLIRGGVVLVVVILGTGVGKWYYQQREAKADAALFALHQAPGASAGAAKAVDYQRVHREHGGTQAAERALLLAGSAMFSEGKYVEAQAEFERFRQEHEESLLVPEALFGIASCLDAQGKVKESLAGYQDLVTRYPNAGSASRAKIAMALIHEASNQPDQALKLYDELNRPTDRTMWSSDVTLRRSKLLAKFPQLNVELARTNAPKVTITRLPNTNAPVAGTNAVSTNLPTLRIQQPVPAK